VAIEHLEVALHELVSQLDRSLVTFTRAVFGLAGCNFPSDEQLLTQALRRSSLSTWLGGGFAVVNDSRVALQAGTKDGVGLVLIAGTGSNCYGVDAHGRSAQAGGVDHILSDEGSGYDIGLRGLRAVVAQLDGRGEDTLLKAKLFDKLKVKNLEELYSQVYTHYTTKPQIASLAVIVSECADEGDTVARDILNHSVNELLSLVDAVLKRLEWQDQSVTAVLVGSVLHQKYVSQRFLSELRRVAPLVKAVRPDVTAAVGAARMAREQAGKV
jgi:N-acetylglucosamine kinase-like BadF-type ATPase